MRSALIAALAFSLSCGAAGDDDSSATGEVGGLAVVGFALSSCGEADPVPFEQAIGKVRVTVEEPGEKPGTFKANPYKEEISLDGDGNACATDVPEGAGRRVTVEGLSKDDPGKVIYWGRTENVTIDKGATREQEMVLSKFGGFSCPAGDNSFTHRMFPTVTHLGSEYYLITGGFTHKESGTATCSTTCITVSDSSRQACIYNAKTTRFKCLETSLMTTARGAHSAAVIKSKKADEPNRVVLIGGANKLSWSESRSTGFAWSWKDQGIPSVEIFEYWPGKDPLGQSDNDGDGVEEPNAAFKPSDEKLIPARVMATVNPVGNDNLVVICGGGQWDLAPGQRDGKYQECEIWDGANDRFLVNPDTGVSMSNNFMTQYRAGHSGVVFERGKHSRILFVGGATEGPIAEIFTSADTEKQLEGTGGGFKPLSVDGPPHSFFQTLTEIGDRRFIMLGGVGWNGSNFTGTNQAYAWELRIEEKEGVEGLVANQISGLSQKPPYFHTAASLGGDNFVVMGGFTDNALGLASDVRFLEPAGLVPPDAEHGFDARGGMAHIVLENDSLLLVGGVAKLTDLDSAGLGAFEIYSPDSLGDFETLVDEEEAP